MEHKIKVGITQGDINGVGYEVILKTLSDPRLFRLLILILLAMHRQPMKIK